MREFHEARASESQLRVVFEVSFDVPTMATLGDVADCVAGLLKRHGGALVAVDVKLPTDGRISSPCLLDRRFLWNALTFLSPASPTTPRPRGREGIGLSRRRHEANEHRRSRISQRRKCHWLLQRRRTDPVLGKYGAFWGSLWGLFGGRNISRFAGDRPPNGAWRSRCNRPLCSRGEGRSNPAFFERPAPLSVESAVATGVGSAGGK